MKPTFLAGAGAALITLPLSGDVPRYAVEADDMASSAWTIRTVRETTSATMFLMDNEHDVGSGSTTDRTLTVELSDEFNKASEDGAPLTITRSYETLQTGVDAEGLDDGEVEAILEEGQSDLAGLSVVFTYDADAEEWSAAYHEDSEGDDEWLDDLDARVDLADLFAGADDDGPTPGDSWDLDPTFLSQVLNPGGDVIVIESEGPDEPEEGSIAITLPDGGEIDRFDEYEGELVATFKEIVEEDEQRFAKIVVKVDVEADLDVIDDLEDMIEEGAAEISYSEGNLVRTFEGELTILWDLDGNHAVSLEGELSGVSEFAVEWSLSMDEMELEISFSNSVDVAHTIEATFGD